MEMVYFFRKLKHISVERMAEKRAAVPIEDDNIAVFLKRFLDEEPELSERLATIMKKGAGFLPIEKEEEEKILPLRYDILCQGCQYREAYLKDKKE